MAIHKLLQKGCKLTEWSRWSAWSAWSEWYWVVNMISSAWSAWSTWSTWSTWSAWSEELHKLVMVISLQIHIDANPLQLFWSFLWARFLTIGLLANYLCSANCIVWITFVSKNCIVWITSVVRVLLQLIFSKYQIVIGLFANYLCSASLPHPA